MTNVTVWTKPACVQCDAVKRRLTAAGVPFDEKDLTAAEHEGDLRWFKSIGYTSAPITEYGGHAVPGFIPAEIDRLIAVWREENPTEAAA